MKRYIDVDKIELKGIALFDENLEAFVSLSDVRKAIAQTPTADVVAVVRCKDCKYRYEPTRCSLWYGQCNETHYFIERGTDFYCSYGERSEG